jgi:adenylate kinase family enzyme
MRVLVFGNSGSGKSTYARSLAVREGLTHLDLDSVVWEPNQIAASPEQQIAMLTTLKAWVTDYFHRVDQWSYQSHRRIFDRHAGAKVEYRGRPEAEA